MLIEDDNSVKLLFNVFVGSRFDSLLPTNRDVIVQQICELCTLARDLLCEKYTQLHDSIKHY